MYFLTDSEIDFTYSMTVTLGDFVYATGGYNSRVCSSDRVFRFSAKSRQWTELAHMIHPRVSQAVCSSRDHIFVVS